MIDEEKLKEECVEIRKIILQLCYEANPSNAHLGSCMSVVEILAILYLEITNIPQMYELGRDWSFRDRVILSKGHAAFALYATLMRVGILSKNDLTAGVRGDGAVLFRHPKKNQNIGIECSSGSLGMGLGYAIGLCEAFLLKNQDNQVYAILGDGECEEGNIWESAMYAGHRQLKNLTVIIDKNNLQLDGYTYAISKMENLSERWENLGYAVYEIDGHNLQQLYYALTQVAPQPKVIIANTIKGKGIPFAENRVEWHDNLLTKKLYEEAMLYLPSTNIEKEIAVLPRREEKAKFSDEHIYYNLERMPQITEKNFRELIGSFSKKIVDENPRFLLLFSDCGKRIGIDIPDLAMREMGIAEQNQVCVAAALADEGYDVFCVAYAPFITGRVWDQIKVFLGYMKAPVKLIGMSAGLSLGDLGATHTAIEDIAIMRAIPNMTIISPSCQVEMAMAIEKMIGYKGAVYLRLPDIIENNVIPNPSEFDIGKATIIKEGVDIAILACGPILSQVIGAVDILEKKNVSCTIINMHTIKPIDVQCLKSILAYKLIISVEEHNVIGGLGSAISEEISKCAVHPPLLMLGIEDKYYTANTHSELLNKSGLDAETIAKKIYMKLETSYEN